MEYLLELRNQHLRESWCEKRAEKIGLIAAALLSGASIDGKFKNGEESRQRQIDFAIKEADLIYEASKKISKKYWSE